MTLKARKPYALVTGLLFIGLVLIALVAEGVLRTHGGDLVVVMWMYVGLRMLTLWPVLISAGLVLAIAFFIEAGQAFGLAQWLRAPDGAATRLVLGHRFDPYDLLAYGLGVTIAASTDFLISRPRIVRDPNEG
ncbi:MAG: DUF2809 domain-containing protein [Parvularculaceae bacterium]|nr:DUF2809 domain-containing protein [Parvularculaceae bacterium]